MLLIAIVFMFTFVTMVGGNPQHHAYGFSNFGNPVSFVPLHKPLDHVLALIDTPHLFLIQ